MVATARCAVRAAELILNLKRHARGRADVRKPYWARLLHWFRKCGVGSLKGEETMKRLAPFLSQSR